MTVQTTTTYQNFAGGQQTLTFNFRTLVSNPQYVGLSVTNLSTNTITILTYNVSYSVLVNSTGIGGTVTVTPTYGTNYQYTVFRSTGLVQNSAYANFNQFPASTLENGLDQLTMISQEITTNQGLTLSLPLGLSPTSSTVLPTPVANNALGWNNLGTALVNLNLTSSGVMVIASATESVAGVQSTHYMTPSTNTIQIQSAISSSTTDVTLTTNSTQVIISSINAATAGSNTILRLTSGGLIPSLNGSLLTNIIGSISSYGSNSGSSAAISLSSIKIAYGTLFVSTTVGTLSGLPFSSSTSYIMLSNLNSGNGYSYCAQSSGTLAYLFTSQSSENLNWLAFGI